MGNYPIEDWAGFLTAAAGAVGVLAGLVFVALSINLAKIIEIPDVASRAADTVIVLAGVLVAALLPLIPHISQAQLGLSLLIVAIPTWAGPIVIQIRSIGKRTKGHALHDVLRATLHQAAALPAVLAGLSLHGLLPGGLTWLAAGILLSILVALFNAWVLLVEILR